MDASLLHSSEELGRNYKLQDIRMDDFLLHDKVGWPPNSLMTISLTQEEIHAERAKDSVSLL